MKHQGEDRESLGEIKRNLRYLKENLVRIWEDLGTPGKTWQNIGLPEKDWRELKKQRKLKKKS
jgi:hypothetical protein